jgi:hypothetical protein
MNVKKINSEKVLPVKFSEKDKDKRPLRGASLFDEMYANIFLCARKKSGKTCVINHIIEKCSTKETKVIAFCSTLNRDASWKAIERNCAQRKVDFTGYTSLRDEATKEDILQSIVHSLEEAYGNGEEEKEPEPTRGLDNNGVEYSTRSKREKRPKEKAPEIIFVFDDLSGELQSPSLTQLLKKNRHFKCKILISSQYWNDVSLQARKQLDYILLFRGLAKSVGKLDEIYKNADLNIPLEVFMALYSYATAKPYSFLFIDARDCQFRKNFDTLITPPKEDEIEDL